MKFVGINNIQKKGNLSHKRSSQFENKQYLGYTNTIQISVLPIWVPYQAVIIRMNCLQ